MPSLGIIRGYLHSGTQDMKEVGCVGLTAFLMTVDWAHGF
jgi:hypothetical protein